MCVSLSMRSIQAISSYYNCPVTQTVVLIWLDVNWLDVNSSKRRHSKNTSH